MNPKNTWLWVTVAVGLFALIFLLEQIGRKPVVEPKAVLPGFKAGIVTSVRVSPAGQSEIRAERTNAAWHLTKPVSYPAQASSIEGLLAALERLMPAAEITAGELQRRPNADEEFGFESPQVSLVVQSRDERKQILIGRPTAPGDQVYLQIVGEGVYLVDADLLKVIPRTADDWRETALVDLTRLAFDRIMITSAATVIELQHDSTNDTWNATRPMRARADKFRIVELLQKLHGLRVIQFVSDDPKDPETFGLQPPELDLAFGRGTNIVALLQFGKSPATNASQVFARRQGVNTIVTVPKDPLTPWRAAFNDFRDRQLLTLTRPIDQIEVRGSNSFTLQRTSSNTWRVAGEDFPVDARWVNDFINTLGKLQIVQFKDAITDRDLQDDGLTSPSRQIILRSGMTNGPGSTNGVVAELSFGNTKDDKVFAHRADEKPIYAVKLADFQQLPTSAWQFRERRIWNFPENDVARLTVQQGGKVRQIVRHGTNSWALAPGSQGMINDLAIEETVHRFGELASTLWVERGAQDLARYGISTNGLSLWLDLKNGEKRSVEFGALSPSQYPYAATKLDGETWVFEFELGLYQLVVSYLAIPAEVP